MNFHRKFGEIFVIEIILAWAELRALIIIILTEDFLESETSKILNPEPGGILTRQKVLRILDDDSKS